MPRKQTPCVPGDRPEAARQLIRVELLDAEQVLTVFELAGIRLARLFAWA